MCSRTTCNALARAQACGKGSPANGPVLKVVIVGEDVPEEDSTSSESSSSEVETPAVLGLWGLLSPFPWLA